MNPVIDTPQGRCVPEKTRQSLRNKERKMEKMSVRKAEKITDSTVNPGRTCR